LCNITLSRRSSRTPKYPGGVRGGGLEVLLESNLKE